MKEKTFDLITLLFFLIPLAASVFWKVYPMSLVLLVVIYVSFIYHLSSAKKFEREDGLSARMLIITNLALIVIGRFSLPFSLISISLGMVALYFRKRTDIKYHHDIWHILSSFVTLFALMSYLGFNIIH